MDRTPRRASHEWQKRCDAHRKADGQQCGKWAMAGQTVCRSHGGAANKEVGLRRSEDNRVRQHVQRAGARLVNMGLLEDARNPLEELDYRLRFLALQIANLEAMMAEDDVPLVSRDAKGTETPSGYMQLLLALREDWRKLLDTATRIGLAQHMISGHQDVAREVAKVVREVVGAAQLDDAAKRALLVDFARRFAALDAA